MEMPTAWTDEEDALRQRFTVNSYPGDERSWVRISPPATRIITGQGLRSGIWVGGLFRLSPQRVRSRFQRCRPRFVQGG